LAVNIVDHKDFLATINGLLLDSRSVLDIGCGIGSTLRGFCCPIRIGIDVHRPYLERAKEDGQYVLLNLPAERLSEVLLAKSVDSVTLIDVIEHFEKKVGYEVLRQAEKIANRKVIIFTPRGYFKQKEFDHYGLGGEKYQRHRSGWEIEDFEQLGYNITLFKGFHDAENAAFREAYGEDAQPIDAILAWKVCTPEEQSL